MLNLQSTKETVPLMHNLNKNFKKIPKEHIKTITFDNGTEFAHHYKLKEKIGIQTYFCDAYSTWQKGDVENMNRRLRRYLPRNSNLDTINPQDILWLQYKMNNTPRKCLGFRTPLDVLSLQPLHFKCEYTLSLFYYQHNFYRGVSPKGGGIKKLKSDYHVNASHFLKGDASSSKFIYNS
jgi:transposase, IS30 family